MLQYASPQKKPQSSHQEHSPVQRQVEHDRSGIPAALKERFESASGFSFSDVRVHYNSNKPAQLQAFAYTQGNDVFIGPGQEKHLSHELEHVVQQKSGMVKPTKNIYGVGINDDPSLEQQASAFIHAAGPVAKDMSVQLRRQPADEAGNHAVVQREIILLGGQGEGQDFVIGINLMPSQNARNPIDDVTREELTGPQAHDDIAFGHTSFLSGELLDAPDVHNHVHIPNLAPLPNAGDSAAFRAYLPSQLLINANTHGFSPLPGLGPLIAAGVPHVSGAMSTA